MECEPSAKTTKNLVSWWQRYMSSTQNLRRSRSKKSRDSPGIDGHTGTYTIRQKNTHFILW